MKKVCIVTGSRAEYGLLHHVIEKVYHSDEMQLQLVVTGMHLSSEYGMTCREIEKDGYPIHYKLDMLLCSDTTAGITKSMGIELIGFADYFENNRPDILLILGDRYEILIAATAAMISRIPIAHICGGETTEGAIDEAIRHAITKMSHLHFTATEEYRRRVIQLGEQPKNVYNVGALGVENIRSIKLMQKKDLEDELHFQFTDRTIMITYHPVTLECFTSQQQFQNILQVMDMHKDVSVIFTKANSDADGKIINRMIDAYVEKNKERCIAYTSLGRLRYLSALQFCTLILGNSSSGIVEVPSFGIPTVNIGDRQKGRICAKSVIHCGNNKEEIEKALQLAFSVEFRNGLSNMTNPYEKEGVSDAIVQTVTKFLKKGINLKKKFYDLDDYDWTEVKEEK